MRKSTCALLLGGVSAQAGNAALAAGNCRLHLGRCALRGACNDLSDGGVVALHVIARSVRCAIPHRPSICRFLGSTAVIMSILLALVMRGPCFAELPQALPQRCQRDLGHFTNACGSDGGLRHGGPTRVVAKIYSRRYAGAKNGRTSMIETHRFALNRITCPSLGLEDFFARRGARSSPKSSFETTFPGARSSTASPRPALPPWQRRTESRSSRSTPCRSST